MTPKYSPICDDPQKYPQNLHTQKILIFLTPPPPPKKKKMKYKTLNPKKCPEPTYENIKVPPPPRGD